MQLVLPAAEDIVVTSVYPGLIRTGSPINAQFKGQRSEEYTWFAIADSLPALTISAERAADQILAACRRGDAELVITVPAKLAILARTVAPELFARAMSLVNRMLPDATGPDGNRTEDGSRTAGSAWASSKVLTPTYAAAQRNNELQEGTVAKNERNATSLADQEPRISSRHVGSICRSPELKGWPTREMSRS